MPRVKLTAGRIRDLSCESGQAFLWDSEAPGMAVRVTPGAKVFIHQGKLAGKTVRVKIGDVRQWDIENAREEARRIGSLLSRGIDPRNDKEEREQASNSKRANNQRRKTTVGEVWPAYVEARRHGWSQRHLADHLNLAQLGGDKKKRGKGTKEPGALASLMGYTIADVTADAVRAWLRVETEKRPTQARLAFGALRAFLNWCADSKQYSDLVNPDACASRIARQNLPKKKAKDDCLQREQLSAWFAGVRDLSNPVMSAYLQALLITGARREELAGLKWEHVDFQWSSLTIRDKVEGERIIPLTPYVATLLASLPRRNEWVFSSPSAASGRLQEPRIPHNKALKAHALPAITLHGLRRSFGTLAEWVECPAGIVAQIMGHKPSATAEKHYRRRPLDLLRMWHTRIEEWILDQASIEQPKEGERALRIVQSSTAA